VRDDEITILWSTPTRRVAGKSKTAMGNRGTIFYENGDRPLYVNSIAVGRNGTVYFITRITRNGRTRADLVEVPATWRLE